MPAAPKLAYGFRNIGIVEVFLEMEPEHLSEADGHIRIAGKVKKDLQGIGKGPKPRQGNRDLYQLVPGFRQAVNIIRHHRKRIGQKQLFCQALNESAGSLAQQFPAVNPVSDLFRDGAVPYDRPGHQLGKQGDIQRHIKGIFLHPHCIAVHVDDIAQRLKRKE